MSNKSRTVTVARVAAYLEAGDSARAERAGRELVKREPRNADAWQVHALVALEAGKLDRARARLERALALRPESSVLHSNLGAVLERRGDPEGSFRSHERALALDREPADNWFNHGLVLLRLDRPAEAAASLRSARDRAPDDPEVRLNLGRALERSGDGEGALAEYRNALARASGPGARWTGEIREALRRVLAGVFPIEAAPDIQRLLVETGVTPALGPAAAAQLRLGVPTVSDGELDEGAAAYFVASRSRLLLDYLRSSVNLDPVLERALAAARAERLREWSAAGEAETAARAAGPEGRVAAALAIQCFHNEYVWHASAEETALLAAPQARLAGALAGSEPIEPASVTGDLLIVSLYRPASALPGADRLAAVPPEAWAPPVAELLHHSLHGPREEAEIARGLPSLVEIRDSTSRVVRSQYEENPYPRWISLAQDPGPELREALGHRFPERPIGGAVESILVAGGGTGHEPLLTARSNPGAQVLSLDLSRASLAYAARMARRLGIDNVRFLQADLLDVATLGETFDAILASGVLHHMADPETGLQALAGVLRPDGVIRIGLYSARARATVTKARAAADEAGLDGSPEGIRAFRKAIFECGESDLAALLRSADFYTVSTCRDLVFHVHERRFTIPEVGRALARSGLRLARIRSGAGDENPLSAEVPRGPRTCARSRASPSSRRTIPRRSPGCTSCGRSAGAPTRPEPGPVESSWKERFEPERFEPARLRKPGEAAPRTNETCAKPPDFSQTRGAIFRWQPRTSRSRNRFANGTRLVNFRAAQEFQGDDESWSTGTSSFEIDGGLARMTLNRPEVGNALHIDMCKEMLDVSIRCDEDRDMRVLVVDATGRMFCAGGDLRSFADHADNLGPVLKEMTIWLHGSFSRFARMRAPGRDRGQRHRRRRRVRARDVLGLRDRGRVGFFHDGLHRRRPFARQQLDLVPAPHHRTAPGPGADADESANRRPRGARSGAW